MAKRGPHPRLATYRPIGSPLGRRTFAHWPHTTGCLSGQKGSHTYGPTGEAGFRLLATYGHTLREVASPLTGHPLATKGWEGDAFARPPYWPPKTDLAK